ncbi:MAG TPA: SRPBCC family protein [Lacunisphaera sp.]|jgi:hypothetical protein|nr:SRPBCC family protein [Lacunisphaera sp.]
MHIRTVSIAVAAPRDPVFNYLANLENLPGWSTEFCERLELRQGRWWAYTPQGEALVDLEVSAATGLLDFQVGPTPDQMALFPVRVLPLGPRRTLVSYTFIQQGAVSDEAYEAQYHALLIVMRGLIRRFGGGELHAFAPEPVAPAGRN